MNASSSKSWYENRTLNSLVSDIKNPSHHLYYVPISLNSDSYKQECCLLLIQIKTPAQVHRGREGRTTASSKRDSASERVTCQVLA